MMNDVKMDDVRMGGDRAWWVNDSAVFHLPDNVFQKTNFFDYLEPVLMEILSIRSKEAENVGC